ncbi:MAG TPA: hypothetical protein EYG73_00660 [Arcobacter sp.]|nr:hypothetical protein [Arcobacter sp.]
MQQATYELLKARQRNMQIPYEVIALQSELGIATVKRFFSGANSSMSTVEKIASVLACDIQIYPKYSAEQLLEEQINKKAKFVVGRVMKTSALEAQKPNSKAYDLMLQKAKDAIGKMSKSQIWS